MNYDIFIDIVRSRAGLPRAADAVTATHATLSTLAERIAPETARRVAGDLPREAAVLLARNQDSRCGRFSFREFCHRVARREHIDPQLAALHARDVVETMEDAVSPENISELRSQLAPDFAALFSPTMENPLLPPPESQRMTEPGILPPT
jgi:uncharacterized protein (DUF2267 family)